MRLCPRTVDVWIVDPAGTTVPGREPELEKLLARDLASEAKFSHCGRPQLLVARQRCSFQMVGPLFVGFSVHW